MTLIVVGSVVAFLAVFAVWAKRQLLETETWKDTSTELLENQDIREQVAGFMVDSLFAQADVQAKLEGALPPRAQPAAGVIAGAARNVADDLANEALQRPKVQELWAAANETAHRNLIEVVEKGGEGDVTLDLGTIISQLGSQIGVDLSDKLPAGADANADEIVILKTDQLQAAQSAIDLLQTLAWALTALALLIFALAIYLARDWRRVALRDVGFAFIIVGVLVLVVRSVAGGAVVNSLASTASVEPAVQATWNIGTSLLGAGGGAMLFYGIVIVIGAWLGAPAGLGHDARRAIAPVLNQRGTAYAALLLILLILFWWSPTPGFERLPTSILLIVLFVVGLEFLRHQAVKDFPDQTWEAGSARWQESGRSLFRRGGSGGGDS